MTPLLAVVALTVHYDGLVAVDRVDLAIDEGRLVGCIGPNGAGKTTLVDAITGFVAPSAGSVRFAGAAVDGFGPHERARAGLVRTFQAGDLYDDLTVEDNLRVGAEAVSWWRLVGDAVRPWRRAATSAAVERPLELLGLGDVRDVRARELPHGTRRLVSIGRALACGPRLLLLDEPAAGLDTGESAALGARIRGLVDDGLAVLLVEHDVDLVFGVCDEVHVLDAGAIIASGPPAEIRRHPLVVEAYLGAHGGDT